MDDKKQIEEMAEILCESKEHNCNGEDCKCLKQATDLFNKGARILPEGAVVLSREEHQKYLAYKIIEPQIKGCLDRERELEKKCFAMAKEQEESCQNGYLDGYEKGKAQARKETAREFLYKLLDKLNDNAGYFASARFVANEIAKQFGVEVEE